MLWGGQCCRYGGHTGTGDPHSTRPQTGQRALPAGAGWLTIRGAASFGRRVHLVGVWGTARLQPAFPLFFLFLIVHSAST